MAFGKGGAGEKPKKVKKPHLVRKSIALLLSLVLCGGMFFVGGIVSSDTINTLLTRFIGTSTTPVSDAIKTETNEKARQTAYDVEAEGAVLLSNNGALPFSEDITKVNVFGWASTDWQGGGSGSGGVGSVDIDLLTALKNKGIETNENLTKMYQEFQEAGSRPRTLNSKPEESSVLYEPSIDDTTYYSEELLSEAKDFSDTAIVVLGRYGGESNDWPLSQYKVTQKDGAVEVDQTRTALDISAEEEALLAYVGANYENVCVVINATNTMNLSILETTEGIDATLLVGYTGQYSAEAIPAILWGEVNPSGRTVDTYAYEFASNPSFASASENVGAYTDAEGLYPADGTQIGNFATPEDYTQVSYLDYSEGIYVGYRWYETADAEGYWDSVSNEHGQGYDGVVQYAFGYGMSYTNFDWEIVDAPASGSALGDVLNITVKVTNTGNVAGKDVVELYYSAPYIQGQIEKSAVVLGDYAKTDTLEPGESQEVVLQLSARNMSSYDSQDANGNGFAGYELDPGTYTLSVRHNSHEIDDASGAEISLTLAENIQYPTDEATGAEVSNKFTGEDAVDGISLDGSNSGQDIQYLSRADFEGTFPEVASTRAMPASVAELNLFTSEDAANYWAQADNESNAAMPTTDADNGLAIEENGVITELGKKLGADYNAEEWDDLLDQLSVSEMEKLVANAYSGTTELPSVGKDSTTKELDGPSQFGGFVASFGGGGAGTGFPCATVLAQTWNDELANEYGLLIGTQAAQSGASGWYAPATNIHRSPFNGRNYEYYSEDALISGRMCGNVVSGAKDAGIYCYVKHFICNDGESYVYRDGIYIWMTEQTLREIYLEPFRTIVEEYGATGLMTSYNRIGAVWTGGSNALLTSVLRDEWGFTGSVVTDFCDHVVFMNGNQMLTAGGDLWMQSMSGTMDSFADSASYVSALREATKHTLFSYLDARVSNEAYVAKSGNTWTTRPESSTLTTSLPMLANILRVIGVALVALVVWRLVVGIRRKIAQKKELEV